MPLTWLADGLPEDALRQLQRFASTGLQAAAMTSHDGWVLVGQAASAGEAGDASPAVAAFAARGIPDACFVCLRGCIAARHAIRSIAFLPTRAAGAERSAVGWVVVTDQHYAAAGIPDDCFAALADGWAQGMRPSCIAFPPPVGASAGAAAAEGGGFAPGGRAAFPTAVDAEVMASARAGASDGGDGDRAAEPAWALLAGRTVLGRGIDAACRQRLHNLAQGLRPARHLAFAPGGGWAIVSDDGVATAGLPAVCTAHLGQLAQVHVVEQLCLAPNGGWLVGSATPKKALPVDPLRAFERQFRLVVGHWRSLADRIAAHRVSSLGVAVAIGGRLAAVTRYGLENISDRDDWRRTVERRLCTTQPPIAVAHVDDLDDLDDVSDAGCRVQRWPAADAACAVRAEGGDAAGRAALTAEVVDALARTHGWRGPTATTGG